jgi:NTE family protein
MNIRANLEIPDLSPQRTDSLRRSSPATLAAMPSRIITLASLFPEIPYHLIGNALAGLLHSETKESVLLVEIETAGPMVSLRDFGAIQPTLNGEFCFADHLRSGGGGFQRLQLRVAREDRELGLMHSLLEHFGRHFRFVLVRVAADVPDEVLVECSTHADLNYLFVRQSQDNLQDFDSRLREARSRFNGEWSRLKTVLCLSEGERARMSPDVAKKVGGPLHAVIHDCPPVASDGPAATSSNKGFDADLRRLAREIGRRRIGLALSSGGAKGLAHIGVIQVLEENGIEVDVIAGCSMGAYVAAVWGYGCDGSTMEKLAREVEGRWGIWNLVDPVFPPRTGFIRGGTVKSRLQRTIGDTHFSELARPIRVVATNLYTLDRGVFSSGEVASAVHASIAIPGVCTPVVIDGETYVDGGIADPLPVEVLEEMGIDRIIAVNTIPTPAYMRCCLEMEREQEALYGRRHKILKRLNRHINYFAPGNILDVMMRAVHGAQIRVAEEACRHADVVLRPLGMDGHWYEFDKPAKFIAMGRRVAEERLDEIKALLVRREAPYENRTAQDSMAAVA